MPDARALSSARPSGQTPTASIIPIRAPMRTTHHLCMDVRGALRNGAYRRGGFTHNDGREMTPDEVFDALCDELAAGHRVIPVGDECEGFSYETGCPGHPITDDEVAP